jgi:hypothetical protein
MSSTPYLNIPHILPNQNQKEVTGNAAFDILDAAMNRVVGVLITGSRSLTASEMSSAHLVIQGSPAADFTLTVPASMRIFSLRNGTDKTAFIGAPGQQVPVSLPPAAIRILMCDTVNVIALAPDPSISSGMTLDALSDVIAPSPADGATLVWSASSSAWIPGSASAPYDIPIQIDGKPEDGEIVCKIVLPRNVTFKAGLPSSIAKSDSGATSAASFSLMKNGVGFGTVNFAASATAATFMAAADTAFAAGDVLSVKAPEVQDTTLADIAITLAGVR